MNKHYRNYPAEQAYRRYYAEKHAQSEPRPDPAGWKFDGLGTIFEDVVIAETGEVCDFIKYRSTSKSGLFWVGAPADHDGSGRPWHGPYEVSFNTQECYWVAFSRVK